MTQSHPLINQEAPSLSLPDSNGDTYTLSPKDSGAPIALFFYPKAGTYGCTKEACQFRDALAEKDIFKSSNVTVIGVSGDSVERQKEFVRQQQLTYPVLSDANGEARKAYHVGKGLLGLTESRITFIIDSKGIVRDVLEATINYAAHAKFVDKWLEKLEAEGRETTQTGAAEDGKPTESEPTAE
ncbi:hypothetical protein NLI96_g5760 [Meripilus lineatus]|uniref:thioredoxin-dependent peroxiredoxin n=1 Tax=Meripilus lineatus TaxID=2056292 RepID=A0AAD5V2H7_9APHY|nr:hypothetical protein NLI96_g5760 [Physisporinus lineatus]